MPDDLDVLIVSPGGVATSMLMAQVARYKRINDPHDRDGLKHLPRPPRWAPRQKPQTTVFVYGSQEEASASILRRGWLEFQAAKLACPLATISSGKKALQSYKQAIREQRRAWQSEMDKGDDVLCLRYDEIWNRLPEVARHIGIEDPDFVTSFPPRRKRTQI
ncbi:hypothetical protein [uncultured Cohaesibacter sp.]|uniref:hypothetical protein n=1 Tax=uncultured Cohaesibacter sp. TaxID=1002546 RepID=UPI0029C8B100|nr:hypothetical protein [uncultured Cohaesibacter sp.]